MSWDGEWAGVATRIQEQCAIDWSCLFENIGSPAVWVPLVYGVLTTITSLTSTEKDDNALGRVKNLARKVKDTAMRVRIALPENKPGYLGDPKDPTP